MTPSRYSALVLCAVLATPVAVQPVFAQSERFAGSGAARPAQAQIKRGSAKQAKALLDRAVAHIEKVGPEKAYQDFNNTRGGFFENDLYVFVIDVDGNSRANGGSPEGLVGMNILDLRDAGGRAFVRDFVEQTQKSGSASVDYLWRNPLTNRVENKTALLKLVGRNMVGVGYYTPRASAEQARAFLELAVVAMQNGATQALADFNDPRGRFVRDDLYVFAVGLDDAKFYAMGANPGLVGTQVADLRDAAGKPIIKEMIALAKDKGEGFYEYVWRNPANNKVEQKHSYVKRVDKYVVGVGYYTR